MGRIGLVHVNLEGGRLSIEKLLVNTAQSEIEKAGVNRLCTIVPTTQPEPAETVKTRGFNEAFVVDGMAAELS